ncbi:hypothetical protein MPLA_1280044 [Mesorhizobium sp. ORS 3359]|nr:hypothetical protein MPLA_1280044 [Mesorhizobium sp. ORS 3359]
MFGAFTETKARRDLSDSLHALWVFDFTHVFIPKPVPTFGRHALATRRRNMPRAVRRPRHDDGAASFIASGSS